MKGRSSTSMPRSARGATNCATRKRVAAASTGYEARARTFISRAFSVQRPINRLGVLHVALAVGDGANPRAQLLARLTFQQRVNLLHRARVSLGRELFHHRADAVLADDARVVADVVRDDDRQAHRPVFAVLDRGAVALGRD